MRIYNQSKFIDRHKIRIASFHLRRFGRSKADSSSETHQSNLSINASFPRSRFWVPLLIGLEALVNIIWALRDHTTPSWDQSHYLGVAVVLEQALLHHGPAGFVHALYTVDPSRAPFFEIVLMPFYLVFGAGTQAGRLLEVAMWPVILFAVASITGHFTVGKRAKVIAVLIAGSIPELVALSHTVLQDFMLATIATIGISALLRTEFFTKRRESIALGLIIAVGTLTKVSFITTIGIPVLCAFIIVLVKPEVAAQVGTSKRIETIRIRSLLNGTIVASLGIGIPLIWYIPNFAMTRAYLAVTFAHQPGNVQNPLALHNLSSFALNYLNNGYSLIYFLLTIFAISAGSFEMYRRHWKLDVSEIGMWLVLGSWAVVPIVTVAVNDNPDPRYAVASFPAIAVITAIALSRIRWRFFRSIMEATAATYALVIVASYSFIPSADASTPSYSSSIVQRWQSSFSFLGGRAYILLAGYGGAPAPSDFGLNVFNSLRRLSSTIRTENGQVSVALLELNGLDNGNNMPYFNQIERTSFSFNTLVSLPMNPPGGLASVLDGYDFLLYRKLPPASLAATYGRVAQLNLGAAAYSVTSSALSGFRLVERIYGGADAGQSQWLEIYERRGL